MDHNYKSTDIEFPLQKILTEQLLCARHCEPK